MRFEANEEYEAWLARWRHCLNDLESLAKRGQCDDLWMDMLRDVCRRLDHSYSMIERLKPKAQLLAIRRQAGDKA